MLLDWDTFSSIIKVGEDGEQYTDEVLILFFSLLVHCSGHKGQVPYTLYQLPEQENFIKNRERVQGTKYEPYFRPDLFVYPEMIDPGRIPINCSTNAMNSDFSDINTLLVPAEIELPIENGWCAFDSGQGFLASKTHFPNITASQIEWWFWFISVDSIHCSLWHPWAHIEISTNYNRSLLMDTTIPNKEKYVGSIFHIKEFIGELIQDVQIHWQDPTYWGLNQTKFDQVGLVASASGEIHIVLNKELEDQLQLTLPANSTIKALDMIHLFFAKKDGSGLECRTRYFLGNNIQIRLQGGGSIDVDSAADLLGIKNRLIGSQLTYLQYHHDQQEMTHLANILPEIYAAFGSEFTK